MARAATGMRAFTSHERRLIRRRLIEKYGTDCQICHKAINMDVLYEDDSFSIDHITPLADGGTNTEDNMWPTHVACNERKGSGKVAGRVRTNRKPRNTGVTQVTGVRLAYTSTTR